MYANEPYKCPISREIIRVPVITNAGRTYDFGSIAKHLLSGNPNDPETKELITTLYYNRAIKAFNDEILLRLSPWRVLELVGEEKDEIILLYTRLITSYPSIVISGVQDLVVIQELFKKQAVINAPFWDAAKNGDLLAVKRFLADSIVDPNLDPNYPRANGITPLIIAACKGHTEVVQCLIDDVRVNPNQASTDCGMTALIMAAKFGHIDIVKLLLADLRVRPHQAVINDGRTPLSIAAQNKHTLIVNLLLTRHLNQCIQNPALMCEIFRQDRLFFSELVRHRQTMWGLLRDVIRLTLERDAYEQLLQAILHSRDEPDSTKHHPLYQVFNWGQSHSNSFFIYFFWFNKNILKEIQVELEHGRGMLSDASNLVAQSFDVGFF